MSAKSVLIGALLVIVVAGLVLARFLGERPVVASDSASSRVDTSASEIARNLEATVTTVEERGLAQQAVRIATDEVTQEFQLAIEEAADNPSPLSSAQKELADRVAQAEQDVQRATEQVAVLTRMEKDHPPRPESVQQQLELASAWLLLHQNQLEEARLDLDRAGGDPKGSLERALAQYQTAEKVSPLPNGTTSDANDGGPRTLSNQIQDWMSLHAIHLLLEGAKARTGDALAKLKGRHETLKSQLSPLAAMNNDAAQGPGTAQALSTLRMQSGQRKMLAEMDLCIESLQTLSGIYGRYDALIMSRKRSVLVLIGISLLLILLTLLAMGAAAVLIRSFFDNLKDEHRRLRSARMLAIVITQAAGLVVIIMIVTGPPNNLSTIVGLFGAGLALVLKDFIVAFCGWFALMGKHGVRVGDWVEIEGVYGEVIDLGLLRTVLLEAGNWTDSGHPTGRRVAFLNCFAIEGHYFNFTTSGQWMWDELHIPIPDGESPHHVLERVRAHVAEFPNPDDLEAQQEWKRATDLSGARTIPAATAVELRSESSGIQVVLRYMTRAHRRYEMRTQLTKMILDLLYAGHERLRAAS